MKIRIALASALLLALAGCGQREQLKPAEGHVLPLKPATAATQPDVTTLLTRPAEAHPNRIDDLLKKSEVRPDDHFNLPPPG